MKRRSLYLMAIVLALAFLAVHSQMMPETEDGKVCFSDDSEYRCEDPGHKNVLDSTLIFVTPWNKVGYDLVQTHSHKVDMVSPVWFYMEKNKTTGVFEFQGRQDIDKSLISGLRNKNKKIKILPRVYVSAMEEELRWFIQEENMRFVFDQLLSIAQEEGLDGYVFDFPLFNRLKYKGPVKRVLDTIKSDFSHLYKMITFAGHRISFTKNYDELKPYLDIFDKILVCTYDYPNKTFDRWLSPLHWFNENIQFYTKAAEDFKLPRNFFMVGLPFYGYMVDGVNYSSKQIQINEYPKLHLGFQAWFEPRPSNTTTSNQKGNVTGKTNEFSCSTLASSS